MNEPSNYRVPTQPEPGYILLPCPFCGGSKNVELEHPGDYYVRCWDCSTRGTDAPNANWVIWQWNRRTPRYSHRNGEMEPPTVAAEAHWELAELEAQLEWEPLPDGEYETQHESCKVHVQGEWLNISDELYDVSVEAALPDNIRLCRRKEAGE